MKNIKLIISIIFLMILALSLQAQTDTVKANPAPEGIFVFVSIQAVSNATPTASGAVKARILRRDLNQKKFSEAGYAQMASTSEEFNNILNTGSNEKSAGAENIINILEDNPYLLDYNFALLNPYFFVAAGAAFYDKDVVKGPRYRYKIEYLDADNNIVNTAFSNTVSMNDKPHISKPYVSEVFHTDTSAVLKWNAESIRHEESFYADVFYQINGKGEFQKLPTPAVKNSTDSNFVYSVNLNGLEKGDYFRVFIHPRNFLNLYGTKSDTAKFFSVNYNKLELMGESSAKDTSFGIFLSWEKVKPEQYYLGVEIQKSKDVSQGYNSLDTAALTDSTYYDKNVDPDKTYYYRFRPVLTEDVDLPFQSYCAGAFTGGDNNLIPPAELKLDKNENVVKLTWTNNEPDVFGYNVYRGSNLNDDGVKITSNIPEPVYTDTINILDKGKDYVYYVTAINSDNIESGNSNKVTLKIKDDSEPRRINELTGYAEEYRINLSWEDLSQKENNIAGYNIYKKSENDENFHIVNGGLNDVNYYRDSDVKPGVIYSYYVTAVNYNGIESGASIKERLKINKPDLPAPGRIFTRSISKGIEISWSKVLDNRVLAYNIYRYTVNGGTKKIGTVEQNSTSFLDTNVKKGVLYNYIVKAESNKTESRNSQIKSERYLK